MVETIKQRADGKREQTQQSLQRSSGKQLEKKNNVRVENQEPSSLISLGICHTRGKTRKK